MIGQTATGIALRPSRLCFILGLFVAYGVINAQQIVMVKGQPTINGNLVVLPQNQLESETVDISSRGIYPTQMHRPAGQFLLVIVNRTSNHNLSFVVNPVATRVSSAISSSETPDPLAVTTKPILVLKDFPRAGTKSVLIGLIQLPVGQFQLQTSTGTVICTIVTQ